MYEVRIFATIVKDNVVQRREREVVLIQRANV
jgi:hypothetical protein